MHDMKFTEMLLQSQLQNEKYHITGCRGHRPLDELIWYYNYYSLDVTQIP